MDDLLDGRLRRSSQHRDPPHEDYDDQSGHNDDESTHSCLYAPQLSGARPFSTQ